MYVHGMPLIKSGSRAAIGENIREMQAAGHPHDQAVAAALSNARKYGAHMAGGGFTPPMGERFAQRQMMHQGFLHSTVPGRTDKLPISVKGGAYVLPADHVAALGQGNSLAGADIVNKMFKMGPYGTPPAALHGTGAKVPHLNLRAPMPHADGGGIPLPRKRPKEADWHHAWDDVEDRREMPMGTPHPSPARQDDPVLSEWNPIAKDAGAKAINSIPDNFNGRWMGQYDIPDWEGDMKNSVHTMLIPLEHAGQQRATVISNGGDYDSGGTVGGKPTDIIAAGGEIVIPPEKIKEYFGDVDKGHKALDKWVVERRKHHIKELRTLKPPRKD